MAIVDDWGCRMEAYFYGFDHTGCHQVDRVLSAVAIAGKMFHYTDGWSEPGSHSATGQSCIDVIQEEAINAARAFNAVQYAAFCLQWVAIAWAMLIGKEASE